MPGEEGRERECVKKQGGGGRGGSMLGQGDRWVWPHMGISMKE